MCGPSVGVEEEFLLADPITGYPVARNGEVVRHAARRGVDLQPEFAACQIEAATVKTGSSGQLRQEISRLRAAAADAAVQAGATLLAVGVPPTGQVTIPLTASFRYRLMAERLGMVAAERGNCGCHVHVEVPDREAAVVVSDWIRPWLPALLALTANSAIHRDCDTGHASWRAVMWNRWPSAGPPPHFGSVADYDRAVTALLDCGAIFDEAMIYWDVRPSVRFPTVEIRVADVPATAAETVLHATLVRAAVMTALKDHDRGKRPVAVPDHLLRTARWQAAHDGLSGTLIDLAGGGAPAPAAEVIGGLVALVRPALDELCDTDWVLDGVCAQLRRGNGASRQRREWRRRATAFDVVSAAAVATLK